MTTLWVFIILTEKRDTLLAVYRFITYRGVGPWFTDQNSNADDYQKLYSSLKSKIRIKL